jgi:hypothetical protein
MAISSFLRERAQAYADHIVATLFLAGGSGVTGWLVNHYGPALGLDPPVALVLAWVVALVVAVALSLLLKPKHKPKEAKTSHTPATLQAFPQGGIVNAPHFEFKPHIEVNPTLNQSQSQGQREERRHGATRARSHVYV